MARNRMLNPEFWLDEEVASLTPHARLLYMGLWGICDDNYATLPDRPEWIKAQVFPYEQVDVKSLLEELEKVGKIVSFTDDTKRYWFVKNFFKHQRVEKPSKPKYPSYSGGGLPDYSPTTPAEEKRREEKISKEEENIISDLFAKFYKLYPRKVSKKKAEEKFFVLFRGKKPEKKKELFEEMYLALEKVMLTPQWTKDNGQFIPHPSTWLNQARWEDEVQVEATRTVDHV